MQILFVGLVDHANLCHRIARAINAHTPGNVARVFTQTTHPFGYQEDVWASREEVEAAAASADWVVSTGDGDYVVLRQLLTTLPFHKDVKLAVTHAGTAYRTTPRLYNRWDTELGARVRFIGCDSLHFAKTDPHARPYFGTCEEIAPELLPAPLRPRVTHSPTIRAKKGTDEILAALERCTAAGSVELDLIENIPPADVPARRRVAHVHVDQLQPDVGGFGQSAIEAMGAGCAVLADMRFVSTRLVNAHSAVPPIIDVRSRVDLEDWIRLLARERDVLQKYREAAWAWSKENSAPEKVAEYWIKMLAAE